jgi:hypothetical protein
MKISKFDSRPLAEKGVECILVDPVTHEKTKSGIVLLGADSSVYRNKQKELQERHRLEGRSVTAEDVNEDALEMLIACTVSWHDLEGEDGKELPLTNANIRKAYQIPEISEQVARFTMNRANFFKKASGD